MERQILVPLDGSPAAEQVVPHALALAAANASTLQLLQVVPPPIRSPSLTWLSPTPVNVQRWTTEATAEAQCYLDRIARKLAATGRPARTTVLVGEPATEILRLAGAEPGIRDIAMASHGRGAMARVLFGSVTQKVLAATPLPLLVVRMDPTDAAAPALVPPPPLFQAPRYTTILVPLDGSACADAALSYAERIAHLTQATLVLAAVTDPLPAPQPSAEDGASAMRHVRPHATRQDLTHHVEAIAARLQRAGVMVRTHVNAGDPVTMLSAAAVLEQAELIVMTTHARGGLKRLWLGSVALGLSAATPLPIMLIRAEESRA